MFKNTISRFSVVSLVEGLSLIALLFVAVPAKYFFLHEGLVKVIGPIHGGIFLLYLVFAIASAVQYKWDTKTTIILLLASIVPFGNFYCEHKIIRPKINELKEQKEKENSNGNEDRNAGSIVWLKRIGISGFLFFLIKGLIWIGVFMGLFKGCN